MKVGSLVICPNGHPSDYLEFEIPPSNDIIYTVSEVKEVFPKEYGIQIEEKPKYDKEDQILWYEMKKFVEVQPPMDLTEIIECQNLNTCSQVVKV